MTKKSKTRRFKRIFAGLVILALAALALNALGVIHLFKTPFVSEPGKPITSLAAQTDHTKNPSTANSNVNQGSANDKNGKVPGGVSNDPSQWATSASGSVTVKSPLKNAALATGGAVAGTAPDGQQVQFRLIDNQAGVVAQGSIDVVDGTFSATVNFRSYSSSGRLDVFNTDPNGREINEVQVPVRF